MATCRSQADRLVCGSERTPHHPIHTSFPFQHTAVHKLIYASLEPWGTGWKDEDSYSAREKIGNSRERTFLIGLHQSCSVRAGKARSYQPQVPKHQKSTNTYKNCPNSSWDTDAFQSVSQFSRSVVSDSLQPHELQHARPPCPSPTPRIYPNSCPLSRWCHPTISSSAVPFSSCPQSFPASESFWVSSLHQVAKVLEFQLQHQSFQWIFRTDFL